MTFPTAGLIKLDHDHLIHSLHHPADHSKPVIYVRGCGSTVWDSEGRGYLDGLAGLWNVNVGHGRAELAEAASGQMKELAYFSSYVGSSNIPAINLAQRLTEIARGMEAVFFASGGAEANETALKTARFYWKAQGRSNKVKVIARHHGYHGVTLQAMSATSMGSYWKMFEPRVPGFVHIQTCYPYRFQGAKGDETVGQAAARELEEAILREDPDTIAAFIGEPIHGAGGVIYPTEDYWPLVRELCTRYGVLLIADEVITGFGRTGSWFGLSHWNVTPDILSFAKGITSGYLPLGGIMVTKQIKDALDSVELANRWMHAFTYSGHPTCCAVALKNLEIIERERLCENAANMGNKLHRALLASLGKHPNVGEVRGGKGLLAAVEFVEDKATRKNLPADRKAASRIQAEMMKRGVVTRTRPVAGDHPAPGDEVFFAPPLVVTEKEIDTMVSVLAESVEAVLGAES
jgi:adenosylmethionine-8-amino-7-oxononanoate aminotransferase